MRKWNWIAALDAVGTASFVAGVALFDYRVGMITLGVILSLNAVARSKRK